LSPDYPFTIQQRPFVVALSGRPLTITFHASFATPVAIAFSLIYHRPLMPMMRENVLLLFHVV